MFADEIIEQVILVSLDSLGAPSTWVGAALGRALFR